MSKLAKKSIAVPSGATVEVVDGSVRVKGPKGELAVKVPHGIRVAVEADGCRVSAAATTKQVRANTGTVWSLVRNAVQGVVAGYAKVLEIEGVGYKFAVEGDSVVLSLGYVKPVRIKIPQGLTVTVDKNSMAIAGIDKELVGGFAADIRAKKKPEPYKGKGIRYQGEVIRRKAGKKATTTGG
jgi:large subunit ribosomal protein L6